LKKDEEPVRGGMNEMNPDKIPIISA
jgi:hypothetical protein